LCVPTHKPATYGGAETCASWVRTLPSYGKPSSSTRPGLGIAGRIIAEQHGTTLEATGLGEDPENSAPNRPPPRDGTGT
jgi:acyl-coenzyme A synthetase/AMP-(fatty) acid ligase